MKTFFHSLFLALLLSSSGYGASSYPFGGWKWPHVLDYYNTLVASAPGGCVIWLEGYGSNSYRAWKRCGVSATLAGTIQESILFPGFSGTLPGTGSQSVYVGGSPMTGCTHGSGVNSTSCGIPVAGTVTIVAGWDFTANTTGFQSGIASNPGKERYRKWVATCTGASGSGSVAEGPYPGGGYHWGTGSTASRVLNSGSISSLCSSADTLLIDFGPVTTSCTTGSLTVEVVNIGRAAKAGSCSCIPLNMGIDEYYPPDTCIFRSVVFDPASGGSSTSMPGSTEGAGGTGHTFTNADLSGMPSGSGGIPVIGSDAGYPPSQGGTGAGGSVGGGGSGTGFTGEGNSSGSSTAPATPGGGSGGGGVTPGTGSGNCAGGAVNCNDDGSPDSGSDPGASTFDSGLSGVPELGDWVGSITGFLSGSPIVSAITGSAVTASGSCSLSGSALGRSFTLDFCPWASVISSVGAALLGLAHLAAFYIMWRS